jgi:hypothetical protein
VSLAPAYDSTVLANWLAEHNAPGRRSRTAITRLRRVRAQRRRERAPSAATMFYVRLAGIYTAEIARRGGETRIDAKSSAHALRFADRQRVEGAWLTLLRVEGWRYYGGREGHHRATLAYLCGRDDAGLWATRVPGTCTTVRAALDRLTPNDVTIAQFDARERGKRRRVLRQGDIYAVETNAAHDTPSGPVGEARRTSAGVLFNSHVWDAETRMLMHVPAEGEGRHAALYLPHPVRFVQQRTYAMGRGDSGGSWGTAD